MNQTEIKEVKFEDYREEILSLRQRVWTDIGTPLSKLFFKTGFYDEIDTYAFHWIIINKNCIIASARLSKHVNLDTLPDQHVLTTTSGLNILFPLASLNRLVISNTHRKIGLSTELDIIRIKRAEEIGCNSICGISHQKRGLQLLHMGFKAFEITSFEELSFYYKRLKNINL